MSHGEIHNLKIVPTKPYEYEGAERFFNMVKDNKVEKVDEFLKYAFKKFRVIKHMVDSLCTKCELWEIYKDPAELLGLERHQIYDKFVVYQID